MFGMFTKKKRPNLVKLIEKDGIEFVAKRLSEMILQKLSTAEIAYQFILEEIEAASQGNDSAIDFAKNSGISSHEYKGAMHNSRLEVDGPDGPQQTLLAFCMQLQPNIDAVVKLRTMIVENIMKTFSFGKYESNSSSNVGNIFWKWVKNNCNSVKFKPQEIETWSDLEELDLRTNDLCELPDDLSIFTGLVELSLFHNNFSIVPDIIFNLTELKRLNLGVNEIVELPRGIGRLKQLETLDLGQNQLISLPSELGELTNLEHLLVCDNNLISLPKEIGNMTALKRISISYNDLSNLPEEIMNLNNLETIELQNNNFTDENANRWADRFSATKCKISFGYQRGNISEPIYVKTNIKGGSSEGFLSEIYMNTTDGETVSNIFYRYSSDSDEGEGEGDFLSMYMANKKYKKISIYGDFNAINSENNIVPIKVELNAEIPSSEDELIGWAKITYIETCNEHNLKPNSKLHIMSTGGSGNEMTLKMMEL